MTSRRLPVLAIVGCAVFAVLSLQPGLDYFIDSTSIDDLVRGDWDGFFINQPMMGSLTLFLRAPLIMPVFHSSLTVVFFVGAAPCVAALLWLVGSLLRRMRDRTRTDRALVVLVCLGSVPFVRIFHWGHPEDVLATALAVGAMFAADRERPLVAGLMLGLAASSKQWAVLAGLPVLLLLPRGRAACFGVAAGVAVLFALPMALGNPEAWWRTMRAASSGDPAAVLQGGTTGATVHVNPFSIWVPLSHREWYPGGSGLYVSHFIGSIAHPLVLAAGAGLPALVWLRSRRIDLLRGLKLLALVMLLRCALDPMSLEYYHLPALVALAAAAAVGGRRELDLAVLVAAGLSLAMVESALDLKGVEHFAWLKFTIYMATVVPAVTVLAGDVYGFRVGLMKRLSRSPRAQAAASSA